MTKRYFFVTGYPRSGTAWLSRFLTVGESIYCHHEAEGLAETPKSDMMAKAMHLMEATPCPYVGNASSGLLACEPEEFADYPLVVIHRPPHEVVKSMKKLRWPPGEDIEQMMGLLMQRMEIIQSTPGCLVVPYQHDFTQETAKRIWNHLFGDEFDFPAFHHRVLCRLDIRLRRWPYKK